LRRGCLKTLDFLVSVSWSVSADMAYNCCASNAQTVCANVLRDFSLRAEARQVHTASDHGTGAVANA
jgi:hypothetical protein